MKTEREMFDEWYKSEYPLDYEYYVNEQDIGLFTKLYWRCFVSWQASASREGYKLVPVEPCEKTLNEIKEKHWDMRGVQLCRSDYNDLYKAMIGAADEIN